MSGIVVRCPNCGTTQDAIGECEACHEATTRWFCPNHEPGLWLDAPLCPTCGARPGVPGRSPTVPTRPRVGTPPRATPASRRVPAREEERYEPEPRDPDSDVWRGPVYSPGDPRGRDGGLGRPTDPWPIDPSVVFPTAARVVSLFGCLRRLVLIAVILFVLAMLAFFGLFGVGGLFYGAVHAPPSAHVARYAVATTLSEMARDGTTSMMRHDVPPVGRLASASE